MGPSVYENGDDSMSENVAIWGDWGRWGHKFGTKSGRVYALVDRSLSDTGWGGKWRELLGREQAGGTIERVWASGFPVPLTERNSMSAISSVSTAAVYRPVTAPVTTKTSATAQPVSKPVAGNDPDHDGDSDGSGVNVTA
jgi:hypothetical protein